MRKRLVRKTFDMIQDLSESENKEVGCNKLDYLIFNMKWKPFRIDGLPVIPGLQEILGELW